MGRPRRGSDRVLKDACAEWDAGKQGWVLFNVFDEMVCDNRGSRAEIAAWEAQNTLRPPKVDRRTARHWRERRKEELRVARIITARGGKRAA